MMRKCALCGASDIKVIFNAPSKIKPEIRKNDFTPTSSDFGLFYDLGKCNVCHAVFALIDEENPDFRRLYSDSRDELYLSGAIERSKTFDKVISHLKDLLPGNPRLLDIGCSYGLFLKLASKSWQEVYGVELNKEASRYAREIMGLNVFCGEAQEAGFSEGYFDAVTAIEVIEHTCDIKNFISNIHKLLKPGGILYLVTPDIGSFSAVALGYRWWSYRKMHLTYFSKKTILEFLNKNGFSVVSCRPFKKTFKLGYILDNLYKLGNYRPFFYPLKALCNIAKAQDFLVTSSFGDLAITARKL